MDGFIQALDVLIPNLQKELESFRQQIKTDASVRVERPGN
jgi:hypothetical protein